MAPSFGKGFEPIVLTKGEEWAILLFEDRNTLYYPDVSSEVEKGLQSLIKRGIIHRDKIKGYQINRKGKRWLKRIKP